MGHSTVMLSTFAPLSVNSAKHLDAHADRPFAAAQGDKRTRSCCAQGDTVRQLRVMRIGADKSAVGTINRPLQLTQFNSQCSSLRPYNVFPTSAS